MTIEPVLTAQIGWTRACPDCGRPQHYTGIELGWCHDALIDTWHCNDPAKAHARYHADDSIGGPQDESGMLTERARQIIADPFAAAFDGVEEAEF